MTDSPEIRKGEDTIVEAARLLQEIMQTGAVDFEKSEIEGLIARMRAGTVETEEAMRRIREIHTNRLMG